MKTGKYREVFGTYRYRRGVHGRPEGKKDRMPDLCRSDALSCGDGERNDSTFPLLPPLQQRQHLIMRGMGKHVEKLDFLDPVSLKQANIFRHGLRITA